MFKAKVENARGVYREFRKSFQRWRIASFQPKIEFSLRLGDFEIKTAQTEEELCELLELRAQVFYQEMGYGTGELGDMDFDFDRYDLIGDHILVRDLRSDRCIATYRCISSLFSNDFYSKSEFELDAVLATSGNKLELGRACVDKAYRNGTTISLIWKGIGVYCSKSNADVLFGCTSIASTNRMLADALNVHFRLEGNLLSEEILPKKKYSFQRRDYHPILTDIDLNLHIPPLLNSYLKAGAKLGARPALDRKFGCIDYFTLLDIETMNSKYKSRYLEGKRGEL